MWTPRTTETDEANRVIQIEGFILLFYCIFLCVVEIFREPSSWTMTGPSHSPGGHKSSKPATTFFDQ